MTEPLRIGTAERQAAINALDEHLAAGRLGIEEYAERSATAANAVLASELRALFTDLPEPHPDLPGPPVAPAEPHSPQPPAQQGTMLAKWGPKIMLVVPLVAVGLFLLTRTWFWFLLIPVAAVLFYGGDRGQQR